MSESDFEKNLSGLIARACQGGVKPSFIVFILEAQKHSIISQIREANRPSNMAAKAKATVNNEVN